MKIFSVIISVVLICGCHFTATKQNAYSGDGDYCICSNSLARGYKVAFQHFSADKSYCASYKIVNLPSVGRAPYVFLSFRSDASDNIKSNITASFQITLEDSSGKKLHSINLQLAKSIWRWSQDKFDVYDEKQSVFSFDSSGSYTLHVSYTPGSIPPPAKEVYFNIDNCAFY